MKETSEATGNSWSGPLKGWRWLAAWALLISCLAIVTRFVLVLSDYNPNGPGKVSPWILSIGIPLAALILLGLLARCLSSWHGVKRLLLGLGCLTGLVALFYAEENIRGRLAWGHFKAQWEAKGEKFDFAAFIPPPVPAEQNFAMAPVVVGTYGQILDANGHRITPYNTNVINRLQMPVEIGNVGPTNGMGNWQKALPINLEAWQQYYRKLALTTNLFPVASIPQLPAVDVLTALSRYDSTIEELRRAAALPTARFPLNYDNEEPFSILLPHLAPNKGCAIVLRLRALAELEVGQSDAALADISLALRLTEKIRSEPFLISHLVRIAMLQITVQPIWEGLAKHRWTDAQLSALDQQLAGFDFLADYQAAMRGECVCQVASAEYLRRHPGKLSSMGDYSENANGQDDFPEFAACMIPSGWFYQNQLRSAKFILEKFMPIANAQQRTVSPAMVRQADESLREMPITPYTLLCKKFLPSLGNSVRKFAFAQNTVNLTRIACALERYHLAKVKYPDTLDALAPQFLDQVPRDPIGGQPLHYRQTDDGQFFVYSVGWDEKDDGGLVVLNKSGGVDLEKGDWVWRYPAPTSIAWLGSLR
jgi:hypothetical protein